MNRRHALQATLSATTLLIAGCLGDDESEEEVFHDDADSFLLSEADLPAGWNVLEYDDYAGLDEYDLDGIRSERSFAFETDDGEEGAVAVVVFEEPSDAVDAMADIRNWSGHDVEELGHQSFSYGNDQLIAFEVRQWNVLMRVWGPTTEEDTLRELARTQLGVVEAS